MKQDVEGKKLLQEVLNETPSEVRQQAKWSSEIADEINERLRQLQLSPKEFSRRVGTTEKTVARWLGGEKDFKLSTLAKISTTLGRPLISVQ